VALVPLRAEGRCTQGLTEGDALTIPAHRQGRADPGDVGGSPQVGELGTPHPLPSTSTLAAQSAPHASAALPAGYDTALVSVLLKCQSAQSPESTSAQPAPDPSWPWGPPRWSHRAGRPRSHTQQSTVPGSSAGMRGYMQNRSSAAPGQLHAPRRDAQQGAHQRGFHFPAQRK